MSRVDFYILADGTGVERFACSIAAKAWGKGNRVHIHTESEEIASNIDDLLWTFRDISFVPHEKLTSNSSPETPVTIGSDNSLPESPQVMINLGNEIPGFADNFERIVEIVGGNETYKKFARRRYKKYKESGCEIHDHKMDKLTDHA